MARKYLHLRVIIASFVLLSIILGLFFEPEIVSIYWHARFGSSASFAGWKIPVPRGWWAFTHEQQLVVQKMRRFYERGDPAGIIVETLSPSNAVLPEDLKEALIQANSKKGYAFQEQRPIHIGTKGGECLHFSADKGDQVVHITCNSLPAHLALDLYGRSSDIQTFYSVIGQMVDERRSTARGADLNSKRRAPPGF